MSGYFETMGIPIVRGRGFEPTDAVSPAMVAIVIDGSSTSSGEVAHVMKEGLVLAGIAVAVGLAAAYALSGRSRRCCSVFGRQMFPLRLPWPAQ